METQCSRAHDCNRNSQKTEAGGLRSQPGLHIRLLKKQKQKQKQQQQQP